MEIAGWGSKRHNITVIMGPLAMAAAIGGTCILRLNWIHGELKRGCCTWWFPWLSMTFPWIFHDISIYSHHTGNIRTIVLTDYMGNPYIPHGIHVFLMEFHEFPMGYSWVISIRELLIKNRVNGRTEKWDIYAVINSSCCLCRACEWQVQDH